MVRMNVTVLCQRCRGILKKLSGPILDRIDLHLDLEPAPPEVMAIAAQSTQDHSNADSDILKVVSDTRTRQFERQECCNAHLSGERL